MKYSDLQDLSTACVVVLSQQFLYLCQLQRLAKDLDSLLENLGKVALDVPSL